MTTRDALRTLAAQLPAETPIPVPAELLLELLATPAHTEAVPSDLTVAQVAARYGRAPSTVRGWCEANRLPGAYRLNGREWRISASALKHFEATQQRVHSRVPHPGTTARGKRRLTLGAWRSTA